MPITGIGRLSQPAITTKDIKEKQPTTGFVGVGKLSGKEEIKPADKELQARQLLSEISMDTGQKDVVIKEEGGFFSDIANKVTSGLQSVASFVKNVFEPITPKGALIAEVGEGLSEEEKTKAEEAIKKKVTPVGDEIKIPFIQKAINIPAGADTGITKYAETIKGIAELPERVFNTVVQVPEIIKTGQAPKQKKIFEVQSIQQEAQDAINAGLSPTTAFFLYGFQGILDIAVVGSWLDSATKNILKDIPEKSLEIEKARQAMGLPENFTEADRSSAFRQISRVTHPDTGLVPNDLAFKELSENNEIIKKAIKSGYNVQPSVVQRAVRKSADILQTPVDELFTKKATEAVTQPFLGVSGLIPEKTGGEIGRELVTKEVTKPVIKGVGGLAVTEKAITPIAKAPIPQEPRVVSTIKTSGLSKSVKTKAIKDKLIYGFDRQFRDLPDYDRRIKLEDMSRATDLVLNDYDTAFKIAMGQEKPPMNMLPEDVYVAVNQYATELKDVDTIRRLATESALIGEATLMGQRIQALSQLNPDSSLNKIKEVKQVRQKNLERITKETKKSVTKEIKNEMDAILKPKEKISWDKFIDEITC